MEIKKFSLPMEWLETKKKFPYQWNGWKQKKSFLTNGMVGNKKKVSLPMEWLETKKNPYT